MRAIETDMSATHGLFVDQLIFTWYAEAYDLWQHRFIVFRISKCDQVCDSRLAMAIVFAMGLQRDTGTTRFPVVWLGKSLTRGVTFPLTYPLLAGAILYIFCLNSCKAPTPRSANLQ